MATISIQGNDYDSYVTLTDANIYMIARIGSPEWNAADQTTKLQSLVTGTRWIERIIGRLVAPTDVPDPSVDPAPDLIQDAATEAAYALVVDSDLQNKAAATSDNNKVLQAGSAKLERFKPQSGTALPTIAQQLVNAWITSIGGGTLTANEAFGTGGVTEFCELDQFGRSVGFP